MPAPTTLPDTSPASVLNLAYSDNIGPFNITGYGWCGGNHPYLDEVTRTARNVGYHIYVDGKEIKEDMSALTKEIKITVTNEIMNPSKADTSSGKTLLNDVLCIETVSYSVYRNNIQVSVSHEFQNESPVTVQMYYGMQSMFEKETHTLTAGGKYTDWTVQKEVSTFTKKEYPSFRRFIDEGIIDNQKVLFIDCKKSVNKMIQLPDGYIKKTFTIREKSESITIAGNKVTTQGFKIVSDGPGSCVITFNH